VTPPRGHRGRPFDGDWPPPSRPIAVEGGLQARSRRGPIGETWWSRRFIAVLESFGLGTRLQRGRHYARAGQVLTMDLAPGRVTATVQGSRPRPYAVVIETAVLTPSEWEAAEAVMAGSAVFLAKLLAGDMPEEIEEAFAPPSGPLFPASPAALRSDCSCPDWENPCKHIAAVYFLLAEAFDRDPFLIFAWRGRERADLVAGLRARRQAARPAGGRRRPPHGPGPEPPARGLGWPAGPGADARTPGASFWGRAEDVAEIEVRPRRAVAPDLVLRQLDPAPLGADGAAVTEALRPLYGAVTAGASAEALDEVPPAPAPTEAARG